MRNILQFILLGALLVVSPACVTRLASDGVYFNQKALYVSDQAFETAHDILDAFLKWEYENRDALFKLVPGIKAAADNIRKDAPVWIEKYENARNAYMLAPTKDNDSKLEEALTELERLAAAAQEIATPYN